MNLPKQLVTFILLVAFLFTTNVASAGEGGAEGGKEGVDLRRLRQ